LETDRSKLESSLSDIEHRLGDETDTRSRAEASVSQLDSEAVQVRADAEALDQKNIVLSKNLKKI